MSAPQSVLDALADAETYRLCAISSDTTSHRLGALYVSAGFGIWTRSLLANPSALHDQMAALYAMRAAHAAFIVCPSLRNES